MFCKSVFHKQQVGFERKPEVNLNRKPITKQYMFSKLFGVTVTLMCGALICLVGCDRQQLNPSTSTESSSGKLETEVKDNIPSTPPSVRRYAVRQYSAGTLIGGWSFSENNNQFPKNLSRAGANNAIYMFVDDDGKLIEIRGGEINIVELK
jgi:hypothetical protein